MLTLARNYWLALCGLAILISCSPVQIDPESTQTPERLEGRTMGTFYAVSFFTDSHDVDVVSLQQQIDAELELVNQLMSTYIPDSELMLFNSWHSTQPFLLSEPTADVLAAAISIGHETNGLLDVTIRPLVELWGFGAEGRIEQAPTAEQYQQIQPYVGIGKLELHGLWLQKVDPRVSVDLSTIAKGYAVDRVAALLDKEGLTAYLVEVGGEISVRGPKPDGSLWRIAVERPITNERTIQRVIAMESMSLATSGGYRNYFEQDGVRHSHIIDPRSGMPTQSRVVSSTVLHESCMSADAYSTALMVMDADEAIAFAEQRGLAVFLIVKTAEGFEELSSQAFEPFLQ